MLLYGTHLVWQDNALGNIILAKAHTLAERQQDQVSQARTIAQLLNSAGYSGDGEKVHHYLDKAIFWCKEILPEYVRLELLEAIMDTAPRAKAFDEALSALQEAKALTPHSISVMAFDAQLHYYKGNFIDAKNVFEHLIQTHPTAVRSLTLENDLGISCTLAGLLSLGKQWLEKSLETWQGITHVEALTNSNLGYTLFLMGRYTEALNHLQLAETQSREVGSQTFLADTLYRQAGVYFFCGKIKKADDYLQQALQLMREVDDPYRLAYITATYALIEHKLGHTQQAQALLDESKGFAEVSNRPLPWVFYHRTCAMILLPSKQALEPIKTLRDLSQEHSMPEHLAYSYLLEAQLKKNPKDLLLEALQIAKKYGYLELESQALNMLSKQDDSYTQEAQEARMQLEEHARGLISNP